MVVKLYRWTVPTGKPDRICNQESCDHIYV